MTERFEWWDVPAGLMLITIWHANQKQPCQHLPAVQNYTFFHQTQHFKRCSFFLKNFSICFWALFTVCNSDKQTFSNRCDMPTWEVAAASDWSLSFVFYADAGNMGSIYKCTSSPVAIRPDSIRRPFYRGHLKKHKRLTIRNMKQVPFAF